MVVAYGTAKKESFTGSASVINNKKLETLTLPEYAVYQNLRAATIGFGAREEFKDLSLIHIQMCIRDRYLKALDNKLFITFFILTGSKDMFRFSTSHMKQKLMVWSRAYLSLIHIQMCIRDSVIVAGGEKVACQQDGEQHKRKMYIFHIKVVI